MYLIISESRISISGAKSDFLRVRAYKLLRVLKRKWGLIWDLKNLISDCKFSFSSSLMRRWSSTQFITILAVVVTPPTIRKERKVNHCELKTSFWRSAIPQKRK